MDGNELVTLLGHSSVGSPLDDFLTLHNIKIRPKGNSGSYLLSDKSQGLDFEYKESQDFESMSLIVAPTKGKFNLISIEFKSTASKKQRPYVGRLPFGLEFSMGPDDVTRALGSPKDGLQPSETSGSISIHSCTQCLVTVAHLLGEKGIDWVRISVPTVQDRKDGYFV